MRLLGRALYWFNGTDDVPVSPGIKAAANSLSMAPASDAVFTTSAAQIAAIPLATAVASLAAGGTTAPVSVPISASYILRYVFGGTTPSLVVETLGPDGTTWIALTTAISASGQQGVVLGTNASVRLHNTGANAITGLSADLV